MDKIHPSTLGDWAACPRKAYAKYSSTEPKVRFVAEYVGTAAHELAAGRKMPDQGGPMLFDSLTRNIEDAHRQARGIADSLARLCDSQGMERIETELPVAGGPFEGTIDMVLRETKVSEDGGYHEFTIADLKTGHEIPHGVWLQLGAYAWAYNASHWPAVNVRVIHIRRDRYTEFQPEWHERSASQCADAALALGREVSDWLSESTLPTVPARPGHACFNCSLSHKDCAVKATY